MTTRPTPTNPRGPATWPNWRDARPGVTRVEHVRSGARGTFVRWPATQRGRTPGFAVVAWDTGTTGRVVAFAFDLRATSTDQEA